MERVLTDDYIGTTLKRRPSPSSSPALTSLNPTTPTITACGCSGDTAVMTHDGVRKVSVTDKTEIVLNGPDINTHEIFIVYRIGIG
jgi:hypothetical protein